MFQYPFKTFSSPKNACVCRLLFCGSSTFSGVYSCKYIFVSESTKRLCRDTRGDILVEILQIEFVVSWLEFFCNLAMFLGCISVYFSFMWNLQVIFSSSPRQLSYPQYPAPSSVPFPVDINTTDVNLMISANISTMVNSGYKLRVSLGIQANQKRRNILNEIITKVIEQWHYSSFLHLPILTRSGSPKNAS